MRQNRLNKILNEHYLKEEIGKFRNETLAEKFDLEDIADFIGPDKVIEDIQKYLPVTTVRKLVGWFIMDYDLVDELDIEYLDESVHLVEDYVSDNIDYIINDVFESVGDDRAIVNEFESYFPKDRVEKFYHFIANEDNYPNPTQFNTAKDFEEFRSSLNSYYNTDKIYESIIDDFINLFKDEEVNNFIKYLIDKYNIDLNPYSYLD